jgi:KaiC/GvpD/RAD55 family RecA-like ATPase
VATRIDDAVARIDAARARRVASMLAPGEAPEFDHDPDLLVDLSKLDGRSLLARYRAKMANYGTSPFDPDGNQIRFYPGGVSIWSGFPGMGKTTMLRQLICHLLQRDLKVFTASLEEHPEDQIARLIETASGTQLPTDHQAQWFIDQFSDQLRVWARVGLTQHRKLLAVIRKLAQEGVTHAVIDSLMKLDVSSQDFEAQRNFVNLLDATAKQTGCHIHLVAHPKKPQAQDQEPDMNDVAGAKEISGIADNVFFVRKRKTDMPQATSSGVAILVLKRRYGRGQPMPVSGWFHQDFCQFHPDQFPAGATRYLPADAYAVPFKEFA